MSKKKQQQTAAPGVKQSTLIIAIIIALGVGFYLGAMFTTIYRAGDHDHGTEAARMPGGAPAGMPGNTAPAGGEFADEIAKLKDHLDHQPSDAEAWARLGHIYFDTNRFAQAIDAYETSLALKPNDANVLTDLGVMYRRSGDPKKAVENFDKAIAADPSHQVSRFNKGTVLMHDLNDKEGALAAWEGLLEVNPNAESPNGQPVSDLVEGLKKTALPGPRK